MLNKIIEKSNKYIMSTYGRLEIAFEKGEGVRLYDTNGEEYIDFVSGIAVNNLGYSNDTLKDAMKKQIDNLFHTSNLYHIKPQVELAELLVENSDFDKAFFCNSGAEANEGAIKLARKYGKEKLDGKYEIITMKKSFHGRTLTTITATGQEKYQKSFTPLTEGFKYAEFGNIEDLKSKISDNTVAVMIEVIQGEGGINTAPQEYWDELQALVNEKNILLIIDEVQTGIGRTGYLFAYQMYGLKPHMITLAKALGNGMPIGALLATEEASVFVPGDHASTFGGNFLAATAGVEVVKQVAEKSFLYDVRKIGNYFRHKLEKISEKYDVVKGVRGEGLILGLEIEPELIGKVVNKMLEKKVLILSAGGVVLRFVPPLVITEEDVDIVSEKLEESIAEVLS